MATERYSLDFISIGCNKQANCVSWGRNNTIAYAAGKFVALYNPVSAAIIETIPGHQDRVNCVFWLQDTSLAPETRWNAPEKELISCSVDKTIKVWHQENSQWVTSATLQGHKDSVTGISSAIYRDGSVLLASCSADNSVMVWRRAAGSKEWTMVQSFTFGPKMIESIAVSFYPGTQIPLLAAAGVDSLIYVYSGRPDNTFVRSATLAGHEDWIRSMNFVECDNGDLLLASSAQDKRIRLWRVASVKEDAQPSKLDPVELLNKMKIAEDGTLQMGQYAHLIKISDSEKFSILLESVMLGHEEWVFGATWAPAELVDGKKKQPMRLLSASMDRTMVLWEPDEQSGIWIERVRVGEVGGNQLGFFGCQFGPNSTFILSHGYNGAFHLWKRVSEDSIDDWEPVITVSGHFDEARDVAWDPSGTYIVSVSKDQTSRLFAIWQHDGRWHELARPQVHGFDMSCLAFQPNVRHRIISCSEEKVVRVFDAPKSFVENLARLTGHQASQEELADRAVVANVPALGLSNKPVYEKKAIELNEAEKTLQEAHPNLSDDVLGDTTDLGVDSVGHRAGLDLVHPPFEDQLTQRTLWPENHKLYGHGNELVCVASSHSGEIFATACSAKTAEQAGIIVWSTKTWKKIQELPGHKLTVIQLEFSPNDKYLLSVSRDRGYCLYESIKDESGNYSLKLVSKNPKAHTRIVWSCSWSADSKYFATAARDGTVHIWKVTPGAGELVSLVSQTKFDTSVDAIAFAPYSPGPDRYILAIGSEHGQLSLWETRGNDGKITLTKLISFQEKDAHVSAVRRLAWRPQPSSAHRKEYFLASSSDDRSIRIFTIRLGGLDEQ